MKKTTENSFSGKYKGKPLFRDKGLPYNEIVDSLLKEFVMSYVAYSQYQSSLADLVERRQMREALSCGETQSFIKVIKAACSALKKGIVAALDFIVEMNELMADAREKALRLGDSQW